MPYRYLPIEKKHIYNNFGVYFNYNSATSNPAQLLVPYYPSQQGNAVNQRVGDKIAMNNFILDFVIQHSVSLDYPFIPDLYEQGNVVTSVSGTFTSGSGVISSTNNALNNYKTPVPWFANFRLFLIEHDDILTLDTAAECVTWFKDNFVPYKTVSGTYQWTNQCPILRETTEDTGTYKILYDHSFKLTSTKGAYHFSKTFTVKNHLSFTESSPTQIPPTNKLFKFIIIGPLSQLDYSPAIKEGYATGDVRVDLSGVIKTNYIDI